MSTLIDIRTNILYNKDKENNFKKFFEIVFLVDKPKYSQTNSNEIIRERAVEEFRFNVSEKGLESLIETLAKIKDIDESQLG